MRFFDPSLLARTYRDPVAWGALIVDLFPVYAVLALGWGATPLVFLYWLENLVIGAVALARMCITAGREHLVGLVAILFLGPFFILHYGMFSFVHGQFLVAFESMAADSGNSPFLSPVGLVNHALASGSGMPLFISLIMAWQGFLVAIDYIGRGEYRQADISREMMAPYGRIMVLHFALFAGFATMIWLGQPMIGVLALILLRMIWGIFISMRRRRRLETVKLRDQTTQ